MKVAVFGATGSTGSLVVRRLIDDGHTAVGVSRSPSRLDDLGDRFAFRVGDMTDRAFVAGAIADCEVVISCIGQNRKTKSLWSARMSPPDILERVAQAVIDAIRTQRSKRFIFLSAFGVGEDMRKHALLFRLLLRSSTVWQAYQDHARAESTIRSAGIDWTIVRPPGLTDKDTDARLVDRGGRWSSFETVSRKSLARFLVECADDRSTLNRVTTIGELKS